jgi:hypothetical protein
MGYWPGDAVIAELVKAAQRVRSAKLVLVSYLWRSRFAALWLAIAGQVDSLLPCCKRD